MPPPDEPLAAPARLWTRSFTLTVAGTTALFAAYYGLLPILPVFAVGLGAAPAQVGWVIGAFSLAATAARLLAGPVMDRRGRRGVLLVGLAGFAAGAVAYAAVRAWPALLLARIAHGVAWGCATTAFGAVVADLAPAGRRGEAVGVWGLAPTLAMAVAPVAGQAILGRGGFLATFAIAGAVGLIALGLATRLPETLAEPAPTFHFHLPAGAVLPCAVLVLSSYSYGALVAYLPVELAPYPGRAGMFFSTFAAAVLLSRPLAGRLSDRWGRRALVLPGLALGTVGTLVLGAGPAPATLLTSAVLIGFGIGGASHPGLMALTLDRSPASARAGALAAYFTAYDLAIAAGAGLLGGFYDRFGFFALNAVAAAGIAAAFILLALSRRAGPSPPRPCTVDPAAGCHDGRRD